MVRLGVTLGPSKSQYFINQAYISYILAAGYEPVAIVPGSSTKTMLAVCDGLLLPGGIDIDPVHYHENNLASFGVNPEKDAFERAIFYAFRKASKPIFGICRGFQLIARELLSSGVLNEEDDKRITFWQNVNKHRNTEELDTARNVRTHSVDINRPILYGDKKDWPYEFVNSIHHQCVSIMVGKVAQRFEAIGPIQPLAVTKLGMPKGKGYVLEAFDLPLWNCRAVQWHPEELNDVALIQNFFGDGKVKVKVPKKAEPQKVEVEVSKVTEVKQGTVLKKNEA